MSGMERVVRPVVFPDIRPQAARQLPPEEDPTKGICEIKGQGSFVTSWSISLSWSVSYGKEREMKRRVDTARVYQQGDDGTVNRDNFVDVEVANKLWKRGPKAAGVMSSEEKAQRERDARMYEQWVEYYKRVEEKKNIEIKKRDEIQKNAETSGD